MIHFIRAALFTLLTCVLSYVQFIGLKRNIASAKASGIPFVIVPFAVASPAGILFAKFLKWIPKGFKGAWFETVESLDLTRGWHNGSKPFKLMRCSTFLTVSPRGLVLHTSDPDVSAHFLRSSTIGKPHKLLDLLNMYGPTMTGTDGAETRLYRRITAPFFNEHTMRRVWAESFRGAGILMRLLEDTAHHNRLDGEGIRAAVARLTLHVVAAICFKKPMETAPELLEVLRGQETVPGGHQLGFSKAMQGVLEYFTIIHATPKLLLKFSPLRMHQNAQSAYAELGQYMRNMKDSSEKRLLQSKNAQAVQKNESVLDLLAQAGIASPAPILKPEEVMGNIFIFLFAGHEANANTMTFLFYLLACHPQFQQKAQSDIDTIFSKRRNLKGEVDSASDTTPGSSPYDWAFSPLMEGYVGACINEALRLYTVLPLLVKEVPVQPHGSQSGIEEGHHFYTDGKSHYLPGGTLVLINTTSLHTDPMYWSSDSTHRLGEGSECRENPVNLFNPELWLSGKLHGHQEGADSGTNQSFLRPKAGTFVPFSDGSRGCLGKRFALVEMCANITSVLSEYTIELVADDEVEWKKARASASKALFEEIEFHVSLRLTGNVPIRFVKRGKESAMYK